MFFCAVCHLCSMSFSMSDTDRPFKLSLIILHAVMLSVAMLTVVALFYVIVLNIISLNVIQLNIVVLDITLMIVLCIMSFCCILLSWMSFSWMLFSVILWLLSIDPITVCLYFLQNWKISSKILFIVTLKAFTKVKKALDTFTICGNKLERLLLLKFPP